MKYILLPLFRLISHVILFVLKVIFTIVFIIIGYVVAVALSLWHFRIEKIDMLWAIKFIWNDVKIHDKTREEKESQKQ